MACNPFSIKRNTTNCTENYAGVGTRVYFALVEHLKDGVMPQYSEDLAGFPGDAFSSDAFDQGKGFYSIDIKKKSGKVTFESNGFGRGFSNVLTFVVDSNMESMAKLSRIVNNVDTLWMVSDGKGGYFVLYDPNFAPDITISGDTGDAPDSDSGITVTVTASPMKYGFAKWSPTEGVNPPMAADADTEPEA